MGVGVRPLESDWTRAIFRAYKAILRALPPAWILPPAHPCPSLRKPWDAKLSWKDVFYTMFLAEIFTVAIIQEECAFYFHFQLKATVKVLAKTMM